LVDLVGFEPTTSSMKQSLTDNFTRLHRSGPGPSGRPQFEIQPRLAYNSRRAQGADDGLRVTLDYGQIGTDGDLRPAAALLPVLQ
jgi:hypothetical protein